MNRKFNLSLLVLPLFIALPGNSVLQGKSKMNHLGPARFDTTIDNLGSNIGGKLAILYTKRELFLGLPGKRKVFFVLAFEKPNTLTLCTWIARRHKYDNAQDPTMLKLMQGPESNLVPGNVLYVGNVKLDKNQVKQVKDSLQAHPSMVYVLFIPQADGANHLYYDVHMDEVLPISWADKTTNTGVSTNPSPPKSN